jgi:hypothetical protein
MASTSLALKLPEELRSDRAWCAVLHVLERAFPERPARVEVRFGRR